MGPSRLATISEIRRARRFRCPRRRKLLDGEMKRVSSGKNGMRYETGSDETGLDPVKTTRAFGDSSGTATWKKAPSNGFRPQFIGRVEITIAIVAASVAKREIAPLPARDATPDTINRPERTSSG